MTVSTGSTWMAAEIREQPAALRRTLDALLPLEADVAALAARTRQVLFIARGSSDAAALYGRYLCEVGAGRLATPASPSVATRYRRRLDLDGVLAVALSQSGRTEEIVETLAWAADCGAATVAITNFSTSPIAEVADHLLCTSVRETSYRSGEMSARHSQFLVLDLLYLAVAQRTHERATDRFARTADAVAPHRTPYEPRGRAGASPRSADPQRGA